MANTNSNLIANVVALPPVKNDMAKAQGKVRVAVDTFEVAAADIDADGDTVKLARLPARARVLSIKKWNDDLDSGSNVAFNCGLSLPDGTIKDEDAFASAVSFVAADTSGTEIRFESGQNGIDTIDDFLYTIAGDDEGDSEYYDVVLYQTAAAAGAQAGTISFVIEFVVDG